MSRFLVVVVVGAAIELLIAVFELLDEARRGCPPLARSAPPRRCCSSPPSARIAR
jgi:hypothetical protein